MEMRKVVLDENVIPPMTHPWGKVWKQPDRNNLVLDDKYAMMYRRDFEMLPDYTGSEPTGKYNNDRMRILRWAYIGDLLPNAEE